MDIYGEGLRKEAKSTGASMSEAKLAGMAGSGTLQVWRGQKDDVLEIRGTWKPEPGKVGADELRRSLDRADPLIFDGPVDDPAAPEREKMRAEVQVSSINSYHLKSSGQMPVLLVNFIPVEPKRVAR